MPLKLKDLNQEQKIELLKQLARETKLIVSCDEEGNTLFDKFDIYVDYATNRPVIFGYSGSELNND